MGSPSISAFIAHSAFWALLAWGIADGELRGRGIAIFLLFWALGFFGLPCAAYGASLVAPYVAFLDIILVFTIFKGDVPIT